MSAKVLSNLESVGDLVGTFKGIEHGLKEDEYIEGLIRQAHGKAANAFNVAAAASARAGHMTHVFEYGTAGITPGTTKFADPTDIRARLWTHQIDGHGGNMDIRYSFRPAMQPNPKPTTASTGVPSKYLSKLSGRKYIFWNRAFVMETGQSVDIVPKTNGLLFIPFYGQPPLAPRKNNRGYMMFPGNATLVPGRNTKGQFTAFWMMWWGAEGNNIIEQSMRQDVISDTERAIAEGAKRAQTEAVKPPTATNIVGAVSSAMNATRKYFKKRQGIETK